MRVRRHRIGRREGGIKKVHSPLVSSLDEDEPKGDLEVIFKRTVYSIERFVFLIPHEISDIEGYL